MGVGSPQDRRKSQRVEIVLKVEYLNPRDLLHDYITDLGEGGIFIHSPLPFEPGQHLTFTLSFPNLLDPIELVGVVRWRRVPTPVQYDLSPGLGLEFVFSDPAQREHIRQLIASLNEEPKASLLEGRPYKVLVVEDNKFVQELFNFAIRKMHAEREIDLLEILTADDGNEAMQCLEETAIDLAIMDHFLPAMTGCDLIRLIRLHEGTKHMPILMVSVGGEKVRQQAYESGADLYLDKPVLHKQLIRTLTTLLRLEKERKG